MYISYEISSKLCNREFKRMYSYLYHPNAANLFHKHVLGTLLRVTQGANSGGYSRERCTPCPQGSTIYRGTWMRKPTSTADCVGSGPNAGQAPRQDSQDSAWKHQVPTWLSSWREAMMNSISLLPVSESYFLLRMCACTFPLSGWLFFK